MTKCISALILFLSLGAHASDYHSPRTLALGGAGHAGPLINDAIYLNPSYGSVSQTYGMHISYQKFQGPSQENPGGEELPSLYYGRNYNFSVYDGRTELFQAGAGYTMKENGGLVHVAASKAPFKNISMGMGAKMFFPNEGGSSKPMDVMASSTMLVSKWFQVSVVADNLINPETLPDRAMQREFTVGTKFIIAGTAMIYLDPHYTPAFGPKERFGGEAGIELTPFKDLYIRGGYFYNSAVPFQTDYGRGFGTGLGWLGPKLSLDYGFSRVLASNGDYPDAHIHNLGMTVYF